MSRTTKAPTVNTGGEAGQILDHLLCATDQAIRHQDARDLLKLVAAKDAEIAALREKVRVLTLGESELLPYRDACQHLQTRADKAAADLFDMMTERDDARRHQLDAEAEREESARRFDAREGEFQALMQNVEAERDRLRGALEEIALLYHADTCQHVVAGPEYMCACHKSIARAALAAGEVKP